MHADPRSDPLPSIPSSDRESRPAPSTQQADDDSSRDVFGIVIVDHGSRRGTSNRMLEDAVHRFAESSEFEIVEPAHMELAEPSIGTAFDRCVARGATFVIVFPYFLLPGRHWDQDIPRLAADAARRHTGVKFLVTAPFGLHPLMHTIIEQRIAHCLRHATIDGPDCDVCRNSAKCTLSVSVEDRQPAQD